MCTINGMTFRGPPCTYIACIIQTYPAHINGAALVALSYRSADKFLARPTSRFILFDVENISFDVSLVIYINSTNISPIMIINKIYETQNLLSL